MLTAYLRDSYSDGLNWLSRFPVRTDLVARRRYQKLKRALDLTLVLALAPLWMPICLLVALMIKIESPRDPVLFRHERTGQGGRRFPVLKFRSMVVGAPQMYDEIKHLNTRWPPSPNDIKIADDPRVTRVGRLIRATDLDELPQLINVLRGEMTLIGPRPTSYRLDALSVWQAVRFDTPPGLSCIWQLMQDQAQAQEDRARLDIAYLERQCLGLDLHLMYLTGRKVIRSMLRTVVKAARFVPRMASRAAAIAGAVRVPAFVPLPMAAAAAIAPADVPVARPAIASPRARSALPGGQVAWLTLAIALGAGIGLLTGNTGDPFKLLIVLGGAAALIVAMANIEWAFVALVFITFINLSDVGAVHHGAPPVVKFVSVGVLLLVLGRWFLSGGHPTGPLRGFVLLGAFWLATLASMLGAGDLRLTIEALEDFTKDIVIAVICMMLLVRCVFLQRVVWSMLAAGFFLCGAGAYQALTGSYPVAVGGFANVAVHHIVGQTDDYRFMGPLADPNFFGQMLVMLVPLAVDRVMGEKVRVLRLIAMAGLVLLVVGILLTYSRGAFLALGCIAGLFMLVYRWKPARITLMAGGAALFLLLAPTQYLDRISSITTLVPGIGDAASSGVPGNKDASADGRMAEMAVAVGMFLDHPLLGVGVGNYVTHFQAYAQELRLKARHEDRRAHSLFLEIAAERGLLGIGVFAMIVWAMGANVVDTRRRFAAAGRVEEMQLVTAIGISLLAFAITAALLHGDYARHWWLLFGIALSLPQMADRELAKFERAAAGRPEARAATAADGRSSAGGPVPVPPAARRG
jgi:lipopolysaccharide/colanic/teichoic acid biosynthesis glycosyltransferase/O-antigen ligase